jgi:hypothetical protein
MVVVFRIYGEVIRNPWIDTLAGKINTRCPGYTDLYNQRPAERRVGVGEMNIYGSTALSIHFI